jgi:hypothetical protein
VAPTSKTRHEDFLAMRPQARLPNPEGRARGAAIHAPRRRLRSALAFVLVPTVRLVSLGARQQETAGSVSNYDDLVRDVQSVMSGDSEDDWEGRRMAAWNEQVEKAAAEHERRKARLEAQFREHMEALGRIAAALETIAAKLKGTA